MPRAKKCWHPIENTIWVGEYEETEPSPLNPFLMVTRTVRRLHCLGCGREFVIEKGWSDDAS